jgi:hypothetical protein
MLSLLERDYQFGIIEISQRTRLRIAHRTLRNYALCLETITNKCRHRPKIARRASFGRSS